MEQRRYYWLKLKDDFFDEKYIKAIFYHELCHYYVYDHNEQFYEILDKKLENGSKIDKELDEVIVYDEF